MFGLVFSYFQIPYCLRILIKDVNDLDALQYAVVNHLTMIGNNNLVSNVLIHLLTFVMYNWNLGF